MVQAPGLVLPPGVAQILRLVPGSGQVSKQVVLQAHWTPFVSDQQTAIQKTIFESEHSRKYT
jgi:hypothetical protein